MEKHKHVWICYGTSVTPPTILVRCAACGTHGTVYQYTTDEWRAAFYAPEMPFDWRDDKRVFLPLEKVR